MPPTTKATFGRSGRKSSSVITRVVRHLFQRIRESSVPGSINAVERMLFYVVAVNAVIGSFINLFCWRLSVHARKGWKAATTMEMLLIVLD